MIYRSYKLEVFGNAILENPYCEFEIHCFQHGDQYGHQKLDDVWFSYDLRKKNLVQRNQRHF